MLHGAEEIKGPKETSGVEGRIKSKSLARRVAAAVEILAGLVGLLSTVRPVALPRGAGVQLSIWLALLSALGVVIGCLLWSDTKHAWNLSLLWQSIQVIQLSSPVFIGRLMIGFEFGFGMQGLNIRAIWQLGAEFSFFFPYRSVEPTFVFVNLVPVLWLVLLILGRQRSINLDPHNPS